MSRIKVNTLNPFSGNNINFGGHAVPSGSNKNLGTETSAWTELYVSTGSVNFVAPVTLGQPTVTVASIKAGGEAGVSGQISGMIFTEDSNNLRGSFSVGKNNRASGTASLANGQYNTASGNYSHAEGTGTIASGQQAHAEGNGSRAIGIGAHAEGAGTIASGDGSHAEGQETTASGYFAHSEGWMTKALNSFAHAEGHLTIASEAASHAEGYQTTASGIYSHAEGSGTVASGPYTHAGGLGTIASGSFQTVVGRYNTVSTDLYSVFIVGTGTNDSSRQNGFSVETDGTKAHIVIPINVSSPSNPKEGSMYYDKSTNKLYIYNGVTWKTSSFA
jgi:hypothetical protein